MTHLILALAVFAIATPASAQDEAPVDRLDRQERFDRFERAERRVRGDGVHLRIFRDYHLPADGVARSSVVVIGGSVTIDGQAEDDVVAIGGPLRIGPNAVVRGDVVAIGGEAIVDPAAEISGEIEEAVIVWPDIDLMWPPISEGWWVAAAFGATIVRLGIVFVASLLITLIAPGWIRTIAGRGVIPSALVGVIAEVLSLPALLLLVTALAVSIIGIPLLGGIPFLLMGVGIVWVAGFTAVAARVGARLRGTTARQSAATTLDVVTGFVAISAISMIAHVISLGAGWMGGMTLPLIATGLIVEYVAWTVGLGAAIASLFTGRSITPPSFPTTAPAPSLS